MRNTKELAGIMTGNQRAWMEGTIERWIHTAVELEARISNEAGFVANIDEVAMMFSKHEAMLHWVQNAVEAHPEVNLFNVAHDNVRTGPIDSGYRVKYNFLSTGTLLRVEAMHIVDGFSPLHHAMMGGTEPGTNWVGEVHYSFKCHSRDEYMEATEALSSVAGWPMAMRCESSYGRFSYFLPDGDRTAYVKPRLNVRDMPIMKGAQDL
jgi:hypothetical protein